MRTFYLALLALFILTSANAAGLQQLHGHVPAAVTTLHLQPVAPVPLSQRISFSIGLPLRDPAGVSNFLDQVYDPKSPNYHHFLTPDQFTERFGPGTADYQSVQAFARSNGLTISDSDPSRLLVHVSGTVADINRIFHIHLSYFQHPTESRLFFSPDVEPSLDLATPVLCLSGLNDFTLPRPATHMEASTPAAGPGGGSGPQGSLLGKDFRTAYAPGVTLTGVGQTIGLLELDASYTNDIAAYESLAGISNVVITNFYFDKGTDIPSTNANSVGEVSLDIEAAMAMAPGARIAIYNVGPNGNPDYAFDAMASNNIANQLSSSWLFTPDASAEQMFQKFACQNQSFFQASGDQDAYFNGLSRKYAHAGPPSDDPYVTSVGGTIPTISGPGGYWISETTWNGYTSGTGTNGSGGGISTNYTIPSWQTNVDMSSNGGSTTMRNIPDVAMPADNVWVYYNSNHSGSFDGTSCAAPLWAGFTALVNEQATNHDVPPVGFINPAIYRLGASPAYTAVFHDITTGNNTNLINPDNVYYAGPGYDLCTGWGSPQGMNFIDALMASDPLVITPNTGFFASGAGGGLFFPTNEMVQLTNTGTAPLAWSITWSSSWITSVPSNGVLPAATATNINLSLAPTAIELAAGRYDASILISNLTLNTGQIRDVQVQVGMNPITFDDLPSNNTNGERLLPGYANLDWTNFFVINGINYPSSGYQPGTVSPSNAIFNNQTNIASIIGITPFDLFSFDATAAWRDNLQLEVKAYINGAVAFDATNTLSATTPALLRFNYFGVDRVDFITTNGTPHLGYHGTGAEFVMDNLLVATHINPAAPVELQMPARAGSTTVVGWNAQVGQTYQMQFSTNLTGSSWNNLGNPATATAAWLTTTNTSDGGQGFYRLQLVP